MGLSLKLLTKSFPFASPEHGSAPSLSCLQERSSANPKRGQPITAALKRLFHLLFRALRSFRCHLFGVPPKRSSPKYISPDALQPPIAQRSRSS